MKKTIYVVKLGGKLYVQSSLYNLYQATTKDITQACFFTEEDKAIKMAKKARGEVVRLTLSDEDSEEELTKVKEERDNAINDFERLKRTFKKLMGQD